MRRLAALTLALILTAAATGCSGADDGSASPVAPSERTDDTASATDDATTGTAATAPTGPDASEGSAGAPATGGDTPAESAGGADGSLNSTPSIPIVPDTGVPGIDDTDAFCRSWSEFAGSFQALALAADQAEVATTAREAEVVASGAIIAAVDGLDTNLPGELETERDALIDDLVGPMGRRAEQARDALVAAGATDDDIDLFAALWLDTLTATGLDDPDIAVAVPADLQPVVDTAVATFSAQVPAIGADPSLVSNARTPQTDRYLATNCPDQGILGGNDIVDQP